MVTTTFFAMPFTVSAAEATEAPSGATSGTTGDCTWTLDDNGVLTISGNGAMGDYSYSSNAPWQSLQFTKVVIEDGVTSIGEAAFEDCKNLTTVTISDSVNSIDDYAFEDCENLSYIVIPNSVTKIGNMAFWFCENLTSVSFQEGLTEIGWSAFENCISLTSITIPKTVTSIKSCAFLGCSSLTSITVDERNPVYDSRDNCNAIIETGTSKLIKGCANTVIPSSVTDIGDSAFAFCTSLTSIEIPESITSICDNAFSICKNLTGITIPESVTTIGSYAFVCCESLTSINIPYSVTSIGEYAFRSCKNLSEITVDERNPKYDSRDDCNAIIETESNTLTQGCKATVIPNSVTSIGKYAFCGMESLTEIMIPDSVTYIDDDAFDCPNLSTIYGKKDSCAEAYANSHYILFVSLYTIADGTTGDCTWSIDEYGILTISGNGAMQNYSYDDPAPWTEYEFSTVIIDYGVSAIGDYAFPNCSDLRHIIVPNSVDGIGIDSFSGCSNLTIYGEDDSETEDYAVSNNIPFKALEAYGKTGDCIWILENDGKLVITGNGAMLDYYYNSPGAPWNSIDLKEVIIEDGVNDIGKKAFNYFDRLTDITIPDSITSIGEYAFYNCDSLTDVYYYGTQESWDEISIGIHNENLTSANIHFLASTVCDHTYADPTWTWDGYSAATATFTCAECDDVQEITANVVTEITKEPTCTETGIRTCTATVTFNGNTYTDTKEKTVPATGHSYGEPTWTWDGYSAATATFTCAECDDTQVKNATVTSKITTAPTCTETGIRICTAKVTFNGKTYTDTKEKTVPATGHSYGEPTWTWNGYSAATATFACTDCDDAQVKKAKVTTKVTKEPTCTETGIRTCTATVTFNGNTYTDTKEKTIPAVHSYGEPTWTWNGYSSATATFTCADCDDVQVKNAKVTTKITQEPTATETGIRTCTASVTFNGKAYKDTKLKVIPATGQTSDEPGWNEEYSDFDIAPGAVPFYVMGDANSDGVADIKDVTAIQCYLAGIRDLNSIGMMVADVDGDGEVNINDATEIQMYLACFDYTYPIDSIVTYVY